MATISWILIASLFVFGTHSIHHHHRDENFENKDLRVLNFDVDAADAARYTEKKFSQRLKKTIQITISNKTPYTLSLSPTAGIYLKHGLVEEDFEEIKCDRKETLIVKNKPLSFTGSAGYFLMEIEKSISQILIYWDVTNIRSRRFGLFLSPRKIKHDNGIMQLFKKKGNIPERLSYEVVGEFSNRKRCTEQVDGIKVCGMMTKNEPTPLKIEVKLDKFQGNCPVSNTF